MAIGLVFLDFYSFSLLVLHLFFHSDQIFLFNGPFSFFFISHLFFLIQSNILFVVHLSFFLWSILLFVHYLLFSWLTFTIYNIHHNWWIFYFLCPFICIKFTIYFCLLCYSSNTPFFLDLHSVCQYNPQPLELKSRTW